MPGNESAIPKFLEKAIVDAFQIQLNLKISVTVATTSGAAEAESKERFDVMSVMGVKCSGFTGSLALGFPKNTFLGVLETMLGEKHSDISKDNADACSELLNIIYASARTKINETGFDFLPAIPSTICGKEIVFPIGQFSSFMKFSASTPHGPFSVGFSLKKE